MLLNDLYLRQVRVPAWLQGYSVGTRVHAFTKRSLLWFHCTLPFSWLLCPVLAVTVQSLLQRVKMCRGVRVLAALQALLVLALVVPMGQSCPRTCNCYQANEVHCTFRSLPAIPAGLPAHTRRINLGYGNTHHPNMQAQAYCSSDNELKCLFFFFYLVSTHTLGWRWCLFSGRFNSIKKLHDRSLAGLKRVELLMLHSNELHHLPDAVFRDMKSLQVNRRTYLSPFSRGSKNEWTRQLKRQCTCNLKRLVIVLKFIFRELQKLSTSCNAGN